MRVRIVYSEAELAFISERRGLPRRSLHGDFVKAFGREDVKEEHLKALCIRYGWTTGRAAPVPVEWSDEEMAFVEKRKAMPRKAMLAAFQVEFGRPDVAIYHLTNLCTRKGWTTRSNAGTIRYSDHEIAFVETNQTLPRKDLHAAFVERFGRADVSEDNLKAYCSRRGLKTGRTGRMEPGSIPANKGKRCPPGVGGRSPGAMATQFRKGQVPPNVKHLGHERTNMDGYVEISVDERNPHTGYERRYVHKHRWLWEKANGPVPAGMVLKSLDGNRANTDPSNWEAVPQGMLPRLNGKSGRNYDRAPAELKPTIMAVAKLEHRVRSGR